MSDDPFIIPLEDYPQLRRLCWNRPGALTLEGREAFGLYEANWRFVYPEEMTEKEQDLIDALVARYGKGVFLGR